MKSSILFFLLAGCIELIAGTPEIIPPKTKAIYPTSWYAEQSQYWETATQQDPRNAVNWINFFTASRYAQVPTDRLTSIVRQMETAVPKSYELLLAQAWLGGFSDESLAKLKLAYAMNPEASASYPSLVLMSEFNNDGRARAEFGRRLLASGLVSESLLNYSYNVLMSLQSDAYLFTEGDNTTIPLFVLQDVMKIRQDVHILNLDILQTAAYRDKKLKQEGINPISIEGPVTAEWKKQLCSLLPSMNPDLKFYYALTLSKENLVPIQDNLYVVGLASQLSKERLDNLAVIKENFEQRFLLDYLTVDFNGENQWASGKVLSNNYLVPLILLNDHYVTLGNIDESRKLEGIVIRLAEQGGKKELIAQLIHKKDPLPPPFISAKLKIKDIDESMKSINGTIYAQFSETTNEQYNNFLTYLKNTKQDEQYEKVQFDLSAYQEPALAYMTSYHMPRIPTRKEKFFTQYPAVNISYESAVAYCEWLTDQYNNTEGRKFKKVKFRLPSLKEWQIAALGYKKFQSWNLDENNVQVTDEFKSGAEFGRSARTIPVKGSDILYPWYMFYQYRNKYLNHYDCALGNFKIPEKFTTCMVRNRTITPDGYMTAAPVAQYFPNGMGFYDVVGNVAEMIDEKGKACGGSWNHVPAESTIVSVNTYSGPDAAVGFRVFMDVVEH